MLSQNAGGFHPSLVNSLGLREAPRMKILLLAFLLSATPAHASGPWRLCTQTFNAQAFRMSYYRITLEFRKDKISGSGGCNHFWGAFLNTKEKLFGSITATAIECYRDDGKYDRDRMKAETDFLRQLGMSSKMRLSDRTLTLTSTDGEALEFYLDEECPSDRFPY